jgi:hypothetical protein
MFHFQSLLLHIFISPQQRSPHSRFPSQSSHRKRRSVSRAFFYLSLKVPSEGPSLHVSLSEPHAEICSVSRAFFYLSLKVPSEGASLHVPLSEPHAKRRSVSRAFFYLSLKVPPPRSPNGAPMERDARHQHLLLHISRRSNERGLLIKIKTHLSKSPVKEQPSMFCDRAPMERDAPFQSLLLHISLPEEPQSPFCPRAVCKPDKPLDIHRSLWEALIKGNAPFPEPLINSLIHSYLSESSLKELSHNTRGKEYSQRPRSPTRTEGLHTTGCGLVPQRDRS